MIYNVENFVKSNISHNRSLEVIGEVANELIRNQNKKIKIVSVFDQLELLEEFKRRNPDVFMPMTLGYDMSSFFSLAYILGYEYGEWNDIIFKLVETK